MAVALILGGVVAFCFKVLLELLALVNDFPSSFVHFLRVAERVVHSVRGFEASLSVSFSVFRRELMAPKMSTFSVCKHLEKMAQGVNRSTNKAHPKRSLAFVYLL